MVHSLKVLKKLNLVLGPLGGARVKDKAGNGVVKLVWKDCGRCVARKDQEKLGDVWVETLGACGGWEDGGGRRRTKTSAR